MSEYITALAEQVADSVVSDDATREDWERALDQIYGRQEQS